MSAIRTLDTSASGFANAYARYEKRCILILVHVFDRPRVEDQKHFSGWLVSRYNASQDKAGFLHEDPLNRVARYLDFDPLQIKPEYRAAAARIKGDKVWYSPP
jgi:hypothetical protein